MQDPKKIYGSHVLIFSRRADIPVRRDWRVRKPALPFYLP